MSISEVLRDAVETAVKDGQTRYAIARDSGCDYVTMTRWLDEDRDIRVSTADKLAEYFGLALLPVKKQPKK